MTSTTDVMRYLKLRRGYLLEIFASGNVTNESLHTFLSEWLTHHFSLMIVWQPTSKSSMSAYVDFTPSKQRDPILSQGNDGIAAVNTEAGEISYFSSSKRPFSLRNSGRYLQLDKRQRSWLGHR